MGIEIIFKIAGVGILVSVINQILKLTGKEEVATFTTLAGVIVVLLMVLNLLLTIYQAQLNPNCVLSLL